MFTADTRRAHRSWRLLLAAWIAVAGPSHATSCATEQAAQHEARPALIEVARDVWRVPAARGTSSPDNEGLVTQLVVVRRHDRVWLIGSGPSATSARRLRCRIEHELGRPVTDVVNTRAHPELAMGNRVFGDARVWALPDVAQAMRERCASCVERLKARVGAAAADPETDEIRTPTHLVGRRGQSRGVLGPFRWFAWARAPGERALVLQLADERLIVAQGWVWIGALPDLRETRPDVYARGLTRLRGLATGQRVLGEQGDVGDAGDIDRHLHYLDELRQLVRTLVHRGADMDEALAHPFVERHRRVAEDAEQHALNVQRVWRDAEDAWFRDAGTR